jgi:hypothetical protein
MAYRKQERMHFYTRSAISWSLKCDNNKPSSRITLYRDLGPASKKDSIDIITVPSTATTVISGAVVVSIIGYALINTEIEVCG